MESCNLGEQIACLRKQKGFTQEALGLALGISAQAVSKWEHGGAPDVTLLPALAQCLDCSIDALFGVGSLEHTGVEEAIVHTLRACPESQRFELAYDYCWAIQNGVLPDVAFSNNVVEALSNLSRLQDNAPQSVGQAPYRSQIATDQGAAQMNLRACFHWFFLAPQPEDGFAAQLPDPLSFEAFFRDLAVPGVGRLFCLLFQREAIPFTLEYAAEQLALPVAEVQQALAVLVKYELLECSKLCDTYTFQLGIGLDLLPLLLFSGQMMARHHDMTYIFQAYARTRPLLA